MGLKIWRAYWQRQIAAKHAGQLSRPALARLDRHLADCPACAVADRWEDFLDQALRQDFGRPAPENLNRKVWEQLQGTPAPWTPRWRGLPAMLTALGVAAAAAAMVVGTYRTLQITQPQEYPALVREMTPEPDLDQPVIVEAIEAQPEAQSRRMKKALETEAKAPAITEKKPESTPAPEFARAEPALDQAPAQTPEKQFRPPYSRGGLRSAVPSAKKPSTTSAAASQPQSAVYRVQSVSQVRLLRNKIHLNRGERSRLEFVMDSPGRVVARIYSREGRLVKTLADGDLPAGPQALEWDGTSANGQKVASGIYVLTLGGDVKERRFKLAVIK